MMAPAVIACRAAQGAAWVTDALLRGMLMGILAPLLRLSLLCLLALGWSVSWSQPPVVGSGGKSKHPPSQCETSKDKASGCNTNSGDLSFVVHFGDTTQESAKPEYKSEERPNGTHEELEISRATWIIAGFTVALALVAMVQAGMFLRQLRQSRDATRLENRAYVGVKDASGWFAHNSSTSNVIGSEDIDMNDTSQEFKTEVIIENFGKTPANKVAVNYQITFGGNPFDFIPPAAKKERRMDRGVMFPTNTHTSTNRADGCSTDQRKQLRADTHAIFVHGDITYTDVFGKSHVTEFRFAKFNDMTGRNLSPCRDGNEAT